jgi:hypothetical protein
MSLSTALLDVARREAGTVGTLPFAASLSKPARAS